jgi:hypothetical protein
MPDKATLGTFAFGLRDARRYSRRARGPVLVEEEWRILPVIEVHDQHAACRGSLPSEDAALVDGWRKIGSVLSQHTAVGA